MSDAAASADGPTDDVPTPFYNHLMSMIDATALDNMRAVRGHDIDAASRVIHDRWSIRPLVVCTAGLIVVAAVGRILLVSEVSERQPPVATAHAGHGLEARPRALDSTATRERVEGPAREGEPDGSGPAGAVATGTADGEAGSAVAGRPDEPRLAPSAAEQPIGNLGSVAETGGDGLVVARASPETMHTDPVASATDPMSARPLPADAPSSLPSAIETGSVERVAVPDATRIARVISGVRMRAGPSNGDAVLATIAGGRPVEVVGCRQWCEVIFAGQRGWIYKSFIEPSPTPGEHRAGRAAPSSQQAVRPAS